MVYICTYPKAGPPPIGAILFHNLPRRHAPITHNLLLLGLLVLTNGHTWLTALHLLLLLRHGAEVPDARDPTRA